ncbi:cysteine hydrolase family protein [Xylophilus sp.]|uniref:cysteine hydrolase family protein n=1 Tax=Xylophilus sp. TaxID=2653893 RepID=UPI0013B73F76|nr:isochorismatase family cysteine hydrolase [Xylophilus sp.]KAF1050082.1 MAG: N-carbamoylsarcosine amidase [Xylophilus sp.]
MSPQQRSSAAQARTALLIIDMISCWDFEDADRLLPGALRVTPHIAALKARCRRAGVPVVYANDNRGRWRSHFTALVEESIAASTPAARITQALMPQEDDYFVLKPQLSAFFGTPLELLLAHLGVHRLIVTGVASDQCVLHTVADARMRDFDCVVPRDCVASQTARRNDAVLMQVEETHKLKTTPGSRIVLAAPSRRRRAAASTVGMPGD